MDRFLITGGQGFLGAWIARRLLEEGTPFVLLDREPSDTVLRQVLDPPQIGRLELRFGDVGDSGFVADCVRETRATHIVHLAGLQVPACREDPVAGARVNVTGTLNVFEAARRAADRVRSVVYASSAAVAGPPGDYGGPIPDDARHVPRTHYGVFKTANEGNARVYWEDHGIPSVGLRPLSIYGPGREVGITSGPTKAIRAACRGEEYTIPFTGVTGFNWVEDVAEGFVRAARTVRDGAWALNQPGENHDVAEFIERLEEVVPAARGRIRSRGSPLPVAWNLDESGLRRLLGEVPHTPIEEGIRRAAGRFRALDRHAG